MLPWNEVCILFPSTHLLVSLFPVICFELPITGTFFNFPKRSVSRPRKRGSWGCFSPSPSPHFCRIINNFLIFYHGQLLRTKNTILESSSKRRLVCLKEETRYLAGWIGTCHFFIRTRSLTPSPLCGRLSLCSFVVGTIKDCILGDQDVVDVIKRQRPRIIAYNWWCWCGRGGGVWEKMDSPILFWTTRLTAPSPDGAQHYSVPPFFFD